MAKADQEFKRGDRFMHTWPGGHTGEVVLVGVVERYAVVRRPGAAPSLLTLRELSKLPRLPRPVRAKRLKED